MRDFTLAKRESPGPDVVFLIEQPSTGETIWTLNTRK